VARILVQALIAVALLGMGWAAAKAQSAGPAFELTVDAPKGPTTITCVRGCTLMSVENGIGPTQKAQPTFTFDCSDVPRCRSGNVGGWLTR
jgi:hypothetical protein